MQESSERERNRRLQLWHDEGIRCVGVGKCQSEDPFVCFGVKPTQRPCAWRRPEEDEGGKVPQSQEKEAEQMSGQNRAVSRRE